MLTCPKRLRAVQMLVLANACWALSFPTMKALAQLQQPLWPQSSSWFVAAFTLVLRFGLSSLVLLAVCAPTLRRLTGREIWQGIGLGGFASAGLLLQMDGLAYTSASTSAFLTQFYCLTIPVWVALQDRRWPGLRTWVSCFMVLVGVGILSEIDWQHLRIGRGELETLLGSTIFTGQILWLQRPTFAGTNVNHFTLIMFLVIAVSLLPVLVYTGQSAPDWGAGYRPMPALVLMGIMTCFCTLGGYILMNYFQPFLTATQAGLIYCLEPVFATLFALFLPGWFSSLAGIHYDNEQVGWGLLIGGGLITAANLWIHAGPAAVTVAAASASPLPGEAPGAPMPADEVTR